MTDVRRQLAEQLTSAAKVDFLATLLRVARANDISPAELERLRPVAHWIEATEEQQMQALQRADSPDVALEELVSTLQRLPERYLLFRECCAVIWADGRQSHEEHSLLQELAQQLRIDEEARQVMDSPLACSPEGERRFLVLLALTHEATVPAVDDELADRQK